MVAVKEFSWEEVAAPDFENPARQAFRAAVSEIAVKAKATLPDCHGRVDSAVRLVLNGDVELLPDGTAHVASQSNGTTKYFVVNGECQCKDFPKAPSNWCKHRIAAGLHKRAVARAHVPLDAPPTAAQVAPAPPPVLPAQAPASDVPAGLPEAPASVNCYVTMAGRQCQLTLRDTDEVRLLVRLQAILAQYPMAPASGPAIAASVPTPSTPPAADAVPTCAIHGTTLKASTKAAGTFFCPVRASDGSYCRERHPTQGQRV